MSKEQDFGNSIHNLKSGDLPSPQVKIEKNEETNFLSIHKKKTPKWHVDLIDISPKELKKPHLLVISQPLQYMLSNNQPSLQYHKPITQEELEAIVNQFPVETELVICYGDGQNKYRYEVINKLRIGGASTPHESKYENEDPMAMANLDGKNWLNENAPLVEKWKKEGRKIVLYTASQFMKEPSCEELYEKLLTEYWQTNVSRDFKPLQNLFTNFAWTAVASLYKNPLRECQSGHQFFFENCAIKPGAEGVEELRKIFADSAIKYLIHETAVLIEILKKHDQKFHFLFYKQKLSHHPSTEKNSNSETLDFKHFSQNLIAYLPKCDSALDKLIMQYREFISHPEGDFFFKKAHKKNKKPNSPLRYSSPGSSRSSSPQFFTRENLKLVKVTTEYFTTQKEKMLLEDELLTCKSSASNRTERSGSALSTLSDLEEVNETTERNFEEKNKEVKILSSFSSGPIDNQKIEEFARHCYKLFCSMINARKFSGEKCHSLITSSPFNQETRSKILGFVRASGTGEFKPINIEEDSALSKNKSLCESEYDGDIQRYCYEVFTVVRQKELFKKKEDFLDFVSLTPLNSKYRLKLQEQDFEILNTAEKTKFENRSSSRQKTERRLPENIVRTFSPPRIGPSRVQESRSLPMGVPLAKIKEEPSSWNGRSRSWPGDTYTGAYLSMMTRYSGVNPIERSKGSSKDSSKDRLYEFFSNSQPSSGSSYDSPIRRNSTGSKREKG